MKYDIHCHLFNKEVLSGGFRVLPALFDLKASIDRPGEMDAAAPKGVSDKIKRLVNFLRIGTMSSEEIYAEMADLYRDDFSFVPLMLDLSHAATAADQQRIIDAYFKDDSLLSQIQEKAAGLISRLKHAEDKDDLSAGIRDLKNLYGKFRPHITPFDKDGFDSQVSQLAALKEKHGDRVYPFLSVDPRRGPEIIRMVKDSVGPGRTFHGIKLYPPLGFSPSDPLLMGPAGLYAYCEANRIPIAVHSSGGGFATLSDRIEGVSGLIYRKGRYRKGTYRLSSLEEVNEETIEFSENLPNFGKMVEERAHIFNHPLIWRKVLEKYPALCLNLAHLGGDNRFWGNEILKLMAAFVNVYTDLSCWADDYRLEQLKLTVYDRLPDEMKNKIMFGSDFYILMLFRDDLDSYINAFQDIFGDEFDRICSSNPAKFLFG